MMGAPLLQLGTSLVRLEYLVKKGPTLVSTRADGQDITTRHKASAAVTFMMPSWKETVSQMYIHHGHEER